MRSVLMLTALGLLSLAAFSCRTASPPAPEATPPEVRVPVPVEIIVPLAHEPEMRVRPMDARRKFEEAPFSQVAERRYYTRARLVPKPKKVDGRID